MEKSPEIVFDTSKYISKEEYENKVKTLEAQIAGFKTVAEEAQKAADAKIAAIEEEKRVSKIEAFVKPKIADAKKAEETIKKFVDAKVSPEIVAEAMALIPSQEPQRRNNEEQFTGNTKEASANPRAGSYTQWQRYVGTVIRGGSL